MTPYYGLNPSYKIYYVGAEDGLVEDHETWYMDLAEANLHPGKLKQRIAKNIGVFITLVPKVL